MHFSHFRISINPLTAQVNTDLSLFCGGFNEVL